jgi:hypothetical protein
VTGAAQPNSNVREILDTTASGDLSPILAAPAAAWATDGTDAKITKLPKGRMVFVIFFYYRLWF